MVNVKFATETKQIKHKIVRWITGCYWEVIIYNSHARWRLGLFKRRDNADDFRKTLENDLTSQFT